MEIENKEHRQRRLEIERELGIGIRLTTGHETDEEMYALAARARKQHNRRAGVRALQKKYGYKAAEQIVQKFTGRTPRRNVAEQEYGIGRIPQDVDPITEAIAELKAAEIEVAEALTELKAAQKRQPVRQCLVCGRSTNMTASLGPACPKHYDELSG